MKRLIYKVKRFFDRDKIKQEALRAVFYRMMAWRDVSYKSSNSGYLYGYIHSHDFYVDNEIEAIYKELEKIL